MWVKGNTHTHTTTSDGTSSPEVVVDWYKDRGYGFLVLTDHNAFTDPAALAEMQNENFILIPGEEISCKAGPTGRPIHVCALGMDRYIPYDPEDVKGTVSETINSFVDKIIACGGIPVVAHPNYQYGLHYKDLLQSKNWSLFELFNNSKNVRNEGSPARIPVEQIWDILLSKGWDCFALAVDDAHHFDGQRDYHLPGGGWVWVQVDKMTRKNVLSSLVAGNFYSTTGPELNEYRCDNSSIHISVKPEEGIDYSIRFIGKHGQILQDEDSLGSTYRFTGSPEEEYVRAKVISSSDKAVWTQPVRKGVSIK
jgi:hypothetical protein